MEKKKIILTLCFITMALGQERDGLDPVIKSFILPGWGEYSLEYPEKGRTFIYSETALLMTLVGALVVSDSYTDLFKAYAADHAGINTNGKDRQFWVDIGNYSSMEAHNEEHLRFREYDALYPEDGEWDWAWSSDSKRKKFRQYRVYSDTWKLGAKFVAGGIVINHIISAIDARYLKQLGEIEKVSVQPSIDLVNGSSGLALSIEF